MNYLKQKLEERHMTQKELSIRTGIPKTTINRYVTIGTKRPMPIDLAYYMARALDIELGEFMKGILKDE